LMCSLAEGWIKREKLSHVVSGGAAWSDHVAVNLFQRGIIKNLTLHLPAPWDSKQQQFLNNQASGWILNPGETSNYYHRQFSQTMGFNSLQQLEQARSMGAEMIHFPRRADPMQERNQRVANQATQVLAMTFGSGAEVKDGGTAKTVLAYQRACPLYHRPTVVDHLDLNTLALYRLAQTPAPTEALVQTELGF